MLVYDVGNRESFDALDSWLEEIKRDIGSPADFEGVAFAVCANKVAIFHLEVFWRIIGQMSPVHHLFQNFFFNYGTLINIIFI